MERNNDYLKIIEDTFGLFSNDSLSDCKKVIDDVINTFKKNNSHKINDVIPSSKGKLIQTATLSLKVLLQFYEKLLSRSNEKLVLSFDPLLQIIKDFLLNNQEVFDSSSYVEEDLLHIFSLLFKIALLQNSEDNLSALVKFYHYNLDFISRNYTSDDSDIINLNLSLKIVCGLYAVLGSEWEQKNRIQFLRVMNKLKAESTNKEHKLFASLVIYGNDNIVIKTLLFVLPNFITCFKDTEVVDIIWKDISNLISDENTNIQYSRILLILCYLFNMCFFENILANKTKIMKILFEDNNYWKVIQFGLSNNDPVIKKQAMYLLKKTVDLLINTEENIKCHVGCISNISSNLKHAWWDSNFKQEFSNIYADLIVIFEYLNEQQVHIIKPMFRLVENFIKKTLVELNNEITIDFSWVLLIHEQALKHESTQVVKWGLDSLFKLPDNFNSDKNTTVRLVNLLISTLNNTNLYYNDGLNISKKLTIYFDKFTKLKTSEIFFGSFITKVCSVTWNPEALFFVMHALAQISRNSFWKEKEIVAIKNFVEKAFKTHNKIIRAGIQCELLNSIIALTDEKNVSLENMIFVLSSFSTADSLHRGSLIWNNVVTWMRNIYSEEEAKKCLEKHSSDTPDKKFSLKSLALMIVLFFDAYHYEVTDRDIEKFDCFTINAFRKILLSFRGIEKRLYCDKSVFYNHLMLVAEILEKHLNFEEPKESKLLKIMIPFFNDIASYVKIQMMDMSKIEDYYAVPLYNKIIHYILNMQLLYNVGSENIINEFYLPIATHLENYEQSRKPLPSVKMYCWMQLLKTLFNSDSFEPNYVKLSGIYSYLTKAVNEPLRKDFISSEMSLDLQTLWGKMNSEYLESKWDILEYLMRSTTLMQELKNNKRIEILSDLDLINFCDEALTIGGYGVLCPVMSILKNILLKWNEIKGEERIHLIWELILERRKTDSFKRLIKQFVEMLFQIKLILRESNVQEIHLTYTNKIFNDSSLEVVRIFIKHIQTLGLKNNTHPLFCHILARGLIFGPIQKKDEKLIVQICSAIKSSKICNVSEYNISNEIRGRAVEMVLSLDQTFPEHQTFAWKLIEKLLEIENEKNKNKDRYFGDSQVHRLKHRLMQALLLLEPILGTNQNAADNLSKWLYKGLILENPQPSVKYQQEWLLVRIIFKYSHLLNEFWNYLSNSAETKTKGLCSLIAISYHLCKLLIKDDASSWIDKAIPILLPFCMDQHFEVRLYAQIIAEKFYALAKSKHLKSILQKYKTINECILYSIQRGGKGNAGKNCKKLQEDFYLNIFNPLEHYSLRTIYVDLPRLANVGSDEWISAEIFRYCGVSADNPNILIENVTSSLENVEAAKWSIYGSISPELCEQIGETDAYPAGNYQKKMIPVKAVVPALDEELGSRLVSHNKRKIEKDGLIVVASLIDRIPNLGGLARTCEIFGVSEYIVGSLKYVEDKQFVSLSVTAEKWITVKEVKQQNLLNYLLEMKKNGYTIVGAEQMLYSQPLNSVKFPKKSLLLLGNEKEGIPPNLLPVLDICVEIPQVGIIRSLNVHVTGALFIWEYAKQNYLSC